MNSFRYNTIVIGSGAAAYCAAERLYLYGQKDIAIISENRLCGTSRNTGSDKQTYYKLSLSGDDFDSVRKMAQTFFDGGCVDGDLALCEAALSSSAFLHLCDLGVPFPQNRYGEYIGYKTDHDPARRATSVGPYTSKAMTEALEASVADKNIDFFDKTMMVKIFTEHGKVQGVLCLDESGEYVVFLCQNLICATGGPAGMYKNSVYPFGHHGASGILFDSGVKGKNLTEWQYGLASVKPRWNVSGTYMQVLPRFVSTDMEGNDSKEFIFDKLKDENEALSKVFFKGYQWPFDVRKIESGSSIIDILVYEEIKKGRRIFLDFRENPGDKEPCYEKLDRECSDYLKNAGACFGKPIDRLLHMNKPAVDFYLDKGVDLKNEMLEISLCAQHNNGGMAVDCWWQTNIEGVFAIGEVAASHGVYRPGGSALNAGQVGAMRAAKYISVQSEKCDTAINNDEIVKAMNFIQINEKEDNIDELTEEFGLKMSTFGGAVRDISEIEQLKVSVKQTLYNFERQVKCSSKKRLKKAYRLYDMLLCQFVYLSAITDYISNNGKSRGSLLYKDDNGQLSISEKFKYSLSKNDTLIQECVYRNKELSFEWREARKIPEKDDFFENIWRSYRENQNVY